MVVDSSAILAVLFAEPDAAVFANAMAERDRSLVSSVTLVECSILAYARRRDIGIRELDLFVAEGGFDVVPFDTDQAFFARSAFMTYGKGLHAARLNFGDCCAYGLARALGEPLLFKGGDFALTDITPAL